MQKAKVRCTQPLALDTPLSSHFTTPNDTDKIGVAAINGRFREHREATSWSKFQRGGT
jgi:hypothetical protein